MLVKKINLERFETIKINPHELINNKVTPMACTW